MPKFAMTLAAMTALALSPPAQASTQPNASLAPSAQKVECKHVVTAVPGAKPYAVCKTKAEWAAMQRSDSKDANRILCRYVEKPGDRFSSRKVCMPASEWAAQRQLDREAVERIQNGVCVAGAGC